MNARSRSFFGPFNHANYRWAWSGQTVSQIGSASHTVAIAYYFKEAFESGTIVGSILFIAGMASLACLPLSGVLADRHNRRFIALLCNAINAATAALLGVLLFVGPTNGMLLPYTAAVCTCVIRITSTFYRPAFGAMVPDLVPRDVLPGANALYKAGLRGGELGGQALGGFLYRVFGPAFVLLMDALSYCVALICVWRLQPKVQFLPSQTEAAKQSESGIAKSFMQGVKTITDIEGGALFLSMALVINFFATPIFVLMPFHVTDYLRGDAATLGWVLGSLTAGVLLGYACAAKWPISGPNSAAIVSATIVTMCAWFIVFSFCVSPIFASICLVGAGIANGYWSIYYETALQRAIPREALGRVYACFGLLSACLVPVASLIGGVVLDYLDGQTVVLFLTCSILMTLYPLVLSFSKSYRTFFRKIQN